MIKGNCFAGRPIVEAYQLTQDIDLAATILFPKTYDELIQVCQKSKDPTLFRSFIDDFVVQYDVPLKTKGNTRFYTLDFFAYSSPTGQKPKDDLVQMVFETFWKHKKDISSDAVAKARNTEQYLRFLKYKHPKNFSVK